jgi:hypothetical protein
MLNKNLKNLIILGTVLFSILIAGKAMAATNNPYSYPYSYDSSYQYFQYPGYSPEPVKKETKTEEGNTIINNYYYYPNDNTPNANQYVASNRNTTNNNLSEYPIYAYNQAQGVYPNYMAASAFGAYDNGNNNVRNTSYGFLPNTFGQWILTIILILGIIVVYRVIMRQFKKEKIA